MSKKSPVVRPPSNDPRHQLRGVRCRPGGWQVYRRVNGKLETNPLKPFDTPGSELTADWEGLGSSSTAKAGSFAADVVIYLEKVTSLASYKEKIRILNYWLDELGRDRSRASITTHEIEVVIEKWKLAPKMVHAPKAQRSATVTHVAQPGSRLSKESLRKRVAVLQNVYTRLDGKGAKNPVEAATNKPSPAKAKVRGRRFDTILRILAAMPDFDRRFKRAPVVSLTKIRAKVVAFTALDPAQIERLKPADVVLVASEKYPDGSITFEREKGEGGGEVTIPLTAGGADVMREFIAAGAWGKYDSKVVNAAIQRAAASIGIPLGTIRQKDFRHSFLTEMYRVTKDLATVGRFAGHAPGSPQTAMYAAAANDEVNMNAALGFTWRPSTQQQPPKSAVVRAARPARLLRAV
jgi:integrase